MRKLLSAIAILSTAPMALATQTFSDGFNYPIGVLRTNGGWFGSNTNPPPRPSVVTGNLSYPGLPPAIGNSVQMTNANAFADRKSIGTVTTGTLYYSFILQVSSVSAAAVAISGTGGAYFTGFDSNNSGGTFTTNAAVYLRQDAVDTTKVDMGITTANAGNKAWGTTAYSPTDTLFVVGSFTFGGLAQLDVFANGASVPANEPTVHTAVTAGPDVTSLPLLTFFLRQNTGQPSTINVDDVRVGTTWLDVAPVAGDATGDGKIDADDYALLDRGYARYQAGTIATSAAVLTDGDFDRNKVIDANDYLVIDQALLSHGGSLSPAVLAAREAEFGAGYVSALAVPEPTAVGLIGLAGLALSRRRRVR